MNTSCKIAALPAAVIMTVAGLAISTATRAQDEPFSYTGHIEFGAEYNSNLNIDALESSTGKSDYGMLVDAGITGTWRPVQRWQVQGGYTYSGNRYSNVDQLNMDLHMLHADLSHEIGGFTLGGNYYFADVQLDSRGFLQLDQYSLYGGRLLTEQLYLRGSLDVRDKSFDVFTERNADNQGFSLSAYWFLASGLGSVNLGYSYEDEDTRADRFDYTADAINFRFVHDTRLLNREAELGFGYRWQDRDYASATPSIGRPRDDKRQMLDASVVFGWQENLDLITTLGHGNYDSHLPSADFEETRFSLTAKLNF